MGRAWGDSRAPGMQIATHMSPQPEGLKGGEARKGHSGTEGSERERERLQKRRKRFLERRE